MRLLGLIFNLHLKERSGQLNFLVLQQVFSALVKGLPGQLIA